MVQLPVFTCPVCGKGSPHTEDIRNGYCGICREYTGELAPYVRGLELPAGEVEGAARRIKVIVAAGLPPGVIGFLSPPRSAEAPRPDRVPIRYRADVALFTAAGEPMKSVTIAVDIGRSSGSFYSATDVHLEESGEE